MENRSIRWIICLGADNQTGRNQSNERLDEVRYSQAVPRTGRGGMHGEES